MTRLIKYLFTAIICLFSYLFPQNGKLAVSILDFTGDGVDNRVLRACYQKLETSLIESNQYTVIAKNQRDEILKEMKFQNSGVCDEECAVEIGQLVGAEYLMLGEIIGFADLYQVNIKIVNIEKGDVIEKVTKEIEGKLPELLKGMAESSTEITRRIASGGVQVIPQNQGMAIAQKRYGSIIIESNPSGATVLIDNVKRGSTPLELKNIEVGTRKLMLIKPGYITISKGVIINEKKTVNLSELFILKTGDLTITSEPTGALIYLNDSYQGKTPHTISELAIGDYDVILSSENYHAKTESVVVEYDRKNSKNYILSPKPGVVTIIVNPPETNISVGYKRYSGALANGLVSIELPVGRHNIELSLDGYKPVTKNVTLSANEKTSLEVQMYLSKAKEQSDETFGGSVYYKNYVDAIEAARQAKAAAELAAANSVAATEAAIEAAAVKAAKEARENAKRKKEEYAARKVAEEAAAEFVDLPEVSALSGWNIGIAPSIGFLTGATFSNVPSGVTIVINTPYGFIMGPFHFNFSAALGRYLGTYDSAVDGLLNEEHFIDEFNPTVLGIGSNLTLLKIFFTEVHVGTVGAGRGVRGFGGVSLEWLMKKGLHMPFNILVGGEGFISSDMRGAGNPSGWMGIGLRMDYMF